jgi:hypothetical protein
VIQLKRNTIRDISGSVICCYWRDLAKKENTIRDIIWLYPLPLLA